MSLGGPQFVYGRKHLIYKNAGTQGVRELL